MFRKVCWLGLGAAMAWIVGHGTLEAQSTPIGGQFQVNIYTTGSQGDPKVASDGMGQYIVTWIDTPSILGRQRFADGSLGDELVLVDLPLFTQFDVAQSPSGEFVVAVLQSKSIEAHRFDALGTSLGAPIVVSDDLTMEYRDPAIAARSDGGFVVVWATEFDDGQDVLGRRLAADGSLQGDVFQVNDYTTGGQGEAALAVADDGDFVVTWTSSRSPGDDDDFTSIQARAFGSDGQAVGGQFQINTATLGRQSNPSVDWLQDGSFAVVWLDRWGELADPDGAIALQRATVDGRLLGDIFQVNTYTTGFQRFADITTLDDGHFVVAWESQGSPESDTQGTSIVARAFDSTGLPLGDGFQVNAYTFGGQIVPSIASGPDGTWLAAWESTASPGDDSAFESIQGQLLGPFTPDVFADGFESGDTVSWSEAQP